MLLVLALVGCWRPAPYTPPPPPTEEPAAGEEAEGEGGKADGAPEPEVDAPAAEADVPGAEGDDEEVVTPAPFPAYKAVTVQGPVTIVDDYGKPIAILDKPQWELEVRGEEDIRTRVFCGTCNPQVEGWLQAHLLERAK
jgi:hypothetical protein